MVLFLYIMIVMNKLFIIQLIVSFILGGGMVAILSFLAERAHKNIAGVILAFPVTLALGLFFLGWITSPEQVSKIIPSMLFPLSISLLFVTGYPYIAEYVMDKKRPVVLTLLISIFFGFLCRSR